MKNIQVIDGAINCVYDIFEISDEDFSILFPEFDQDIEFIKDVEKRIGKKSLKDLNTRLWLRPVPKRLVNGIHGILFYGLLYKKIYYPTKKDEEA